MNNSAAVFPFAAPLPQSVSWVSQSSLPPADEQLRPPLPHFSLCVSLLTRTGAFQTAPVLQIRSPSPSRSPSVTRCHSIRSIAPGDLHWTNQQPELNLKKTENYTRFSSNSIEILQSHNSKSKIKMNLVFAVGIRGKLWCILPGRMINLQRCM